jgi:hypothetical protein
MGSKRLYYLSFDCSFLTTFADNNFMKLNFFIFSIVFFSSLANAKTLIVKYRSAPVDVTKHGFENFQKQSSVIFNSWYDRKNNYLIINVNGTNYHYCGFGSHEWKSFKNASSLGRFYIQNIKGRFDCRLSPVPSYR